MGGGGGFGHRKEFLGDTPSDMAHYGALSFDLLWGTMFQELQHNHKSTGHPQGHWLIRSWDPHSLPVEDLFHSSHSEAGKAAALGRVVRHTQMFVADAK